MRNIDRPPPGDMIHHRRSQRQPGLSKKRSQYYENEFAAGREMDSTKDRVRNEAIVLAELRTNVIVCSPLALRPDDHFPIGISYTDIL